MNRSLFRLMLLLGFFTTLISLKTYSQGSVTQCWDFEEGCSNPADAFHLGCILSAQSASGTPDNASGAGFIPFDGKYAHMYARQCFGESEFHAEGIILQHTFVAGAPVKISFAVRSNGHDAPTEMKLILVNSMPNAGGPEPGAGCSSTLDILPDIPVSSETIANYPASAIPGDNWEVKTITWTPSSNFNELWFRPKLISEWEGTTAHIYIDHVCIEDLCPPINYTVSACHYAESNQVVVSINGAPVNTSDWTLYPSSDCLHSDGRPMRIEWLAGNSRFVLPINSGCYALVVNPTVGALCNAQQPVTFIIPTNAASLPLCTGTCDDWHASMTLEFCEEISFEVIPDASFPASTQFAFALDGVVVQSGASNIFSTALSGISHGSHEMCVTVKQSGCPAIVKCYEFFLDCLQGPGDDRDGIEKTPGNTTGKSMLISNPSSGYIWISTPFEQGTARLYSIQGALVKSFALNGNDRLDVAELPSGQYILSVQGQNFTASKLVLIYNQQ